MRLKNSFGRILGAFTAAVMCVSMIPQAPAFAANVGDKLTVGNGRNQERGNCDGYSYEAWIDTTGGTGSLTLGKGCTFKAEWSASVPSGNFLARRGLDFGSQKIATDYEYIGMDYEADYRQTGSSQGNSRLCVYGWFQNQGVGGNVPLVEYYIIEDWVDWCPNGNGPIVNIDGADYKIFQLDHNGPSINQGVNSFKQYFSVRQERRTSGHITVSDHFKAWADQGWGIGKLYEVSLNAEGWQSSGVADVTKLKVYTDPKDADSDVVITTPTVEPDENGYFFNCPFEDGNDGWSGRGAASVAQTNKASSSGNGSLAVTGRTDNWNGASISLNTKAFKPGESYGFTVDAMQDSSASEDFKLTLECSVNGEKQYLSVAEGTGAKGEWITLSNPSFQIPSGASGLVLYVETVDTTTSFYIDNAIGALENKIPASSIVPPTKVELGDLNGDGVINIFDVVACRKLVVNVFAGGAKNKAADVNGDGSVNNADLVLLSQYVLGKITKFPEPAVTTTTTTSTTTTTTTTGATPSGNIMQECSKNFNVNVPGNIKGNADTGKTTKVSYYSKVAGANKSANIWVPSGYSSSKKYNVLYMNHGIFGNEDSMLGNDWAVRNMASYYIDNGLVDPFIIVFTQMYSGPGGQTPGMAFNQDIMDNYDKVLDDLTGSLMPYVEQNYSINTGKAHTAIAGFSMGGRESLYCTIMRPDLFGYCCASSPAPGIVPAVDSFMQHAGSPNGKGGRLGNGDFKISSSDMPYLLMIGGGTADGVVGTFPQQYHELFDKNGTTNVWHSFPGGGHDAGVGNPMFYNFFQYLFKT